jgi:chemotaxis family two-component system response regulator Rcp1
MIKLRVLMVEDNPSDVELELLTLRRDGFDVSSDVVQTAEDFTERIRTASYDLILADYNLPQWKGTEALEILRGENLDVPLIVVTGYLGEEKAVDYIKQGATDCVLKDRLARLPPSVRRAQEEKQLRDQHRQAEEELAQKVIELGRSNAELEQFAYVASHDLQEPLRMIANYTQLLAERYRGKLDEQADKYIAYSVDGATRMQALIQDLLRFSRVGRQELDRRTTDCRTVVEQALKNLQAAVQESGAVVNSKPDWQRHQVSRTGNSHDPNRRGKERSGMGVYRVRQRHRHPSGKPARHLCHLPAAAHSHGICRQWNRLVDLQENRGTARRKNLDRRANQTGVLLSVHSASGAGHDGCPGSASMRTTEVLLVDDNPADTDLTSEVLSRNGCPSNIHSVINGVEAIAFLRREGKYADAVLPDFVLLDLNLPRKDGRAVLSDVKADPLLRSIPITIFSTSEARQDIARTYELGANCYVTKPGNLQDYISAVTSIGEFWFGVARLPREEQ